MPSDHDTAEPRGLMRILAWRRVRFTLLACLLPIALMLPGWEASYAVLVLRWLLVGSMALLAFGVFERWPARLPRRLARWVLQVLAVAIVMPVGAWIAYRLTTLGDPVPFWQNKERMSGFASMAVLGLLLAPWMAVSALMGKISGQARSQALAFQLERSELEREALDARLRLLHAQVEPHFLFNTLANVRELVDSGSPQASSVLGSLIAYLRAAVPRLHAAAPTLGQELELAQAYLDVMHMRMPDRLTFSLYADETAAALQCPPMTVLTLVENAVRHGIDPSEQGGRIDVRAIVKAGRCHVQVLDTGVGLRRTGGGLGTGLSTLRERLHLVFGEDVAVRLVALEPRGACAEVEFPAEGRPR